jgi:outer membrane immunogenic protein
LATLAGSALAADLPSRRAPPVYIPPPPAFSWTGVYVGGQVGYAFGRDTSSLVFNPTGAIFPGASSSPHGIIGGAHIGYNFAPFGAGFIFGLEGDVDGSDYRHTYPFGAIKVTDPIQGSVRGRVGYAIDRTLFYATGGAAFGTFTDTYVIPAGLGFDKVSTTKVGYTVGGGVEYAITNNWSLRAEYRYTDFGSFNDPLTNITGGLVSVHHKEIQSRAQVGFSYKFDTAPPPVVARY